MLSPVQTTAPASLPVSVAECKSHLNISHSADDALILIYLEAAIALLDGRAGLLNRCIVPQIWRQDFHCWPTNRILRLPFPNVSTVTLKYSDTDNVEQTVAAGSYALLEDSAGSFLRLKDAFDRSSLYDDREDPIRVALTAGFGTIPGAIRQAILLMVGSFYENREEVVVGPGMDARELPKAVTRLIKPFRRVGV